MKTVSAKILYNSTQLIVTNWRSSGEFYFLCLWHGAGLTDLRNMILFYSTSLGRSGEQMLFYLTIPHLNLLEGTRRWIRCGFFGQSVDWNYPCFQTQDFQVIQRKVILKTLGLRQSSERQRGDSLYQLRLVLKGSQSEQCNASFLFWTSVFFQHFGLPSGCHLLNTCLPACSFKCCVDMMNWHWSRPFKRAMHSAADSEQVSLC